MAKVLNVVSKLPGGAAALSGATKLGQAAKLKGLAALAKGKGMVGTVSQATKARVAQGVFRGTTAVKGTAAWAKAHVGAAGQRLKATMTPSAAAEHALAGVPHGMKPGAAAVKPPVSLGDHINQVRGQGPAGAGSRAPRGGAPLSTPGKAPHPLESGVHPLSHPSWGQLTAQQRMAAIKTQNVQAQQAIKDAFKDKPLVEHIKDGSLPKIPGYGWVRHDAVLSSQASAGHLRLIPQPGFGHLRPVKVGSLKQGGTITPGAQRISAGRDVMEGTTAPTRRRCRASNRKTCTCLRAGACTTGTPTP